MQFPIKKIGLQAKWLNAVLTFAAPILLIFAFRWFLYEPFVIPSESMVPNLLVHDHILVNKHRYGIKWPMGDGWLFMFSKPQRGEVIVFRFPENREVFFIKRVIGVGGDVIKVQNGQISINGQPWVITPLPEDSYEDEDEFNYFFESVPDAFKKPHIIRLYASHDHLDPVEKEFVVPKGQYFVMGDNRDESHDSRFWGMVDESLVVGSASVIWLSCEETMESAPMICDPRELRIDRLFKRLDGL